MRAFGGRFRLVGRGVQRHAAGAPRRRAQLSRAETRRNLGIQPHRHLRAHRGPPPGPAAPSNSPSMPLTACAKRKASIQRQVMKHTRTASVLRRAGDHGVSESPSAKCRETLTDAQIISPKIINHKGFALLEILLAIALFSLVSVGMTQAIDGIAKTTTAARQEAQVLRVLESVLAEVAHQPEFKATKITSPKRPTASMPAPRLRRSNSSPKTRSSSTTCLPHPRRSMDLRRHLAPHETQHGNLCVFTQQPDLKIQACKASRNAAASAASLLEVSWHWSSSAWCSSALWRGECHHAARQVDEQARVAETRISNFVTQWRDYLETMPPGISSPRGRKSRAWLLRQSVHPRRPHALRVGSPPEAGRRRRIRPRACPKERKDPQPRRAPSQAPKSPSPKVSSPPSPSFRSWKTSSRCSGSSMSRGKEMVHRAGTPKSAPTAALHEAPLRLPQRSA
jgi:prepilin-type N-terminal cleavage/methylation domain-containing protein